MAKEARYWQREEAGRIKCGLCPHGCRLLEGQTGLCGVRRVESSRLVSLNYGCVASLAVDPIEKKPLYHFHPGSAILSVGLPGCNLKCDFCQNWSLSQVRGGMPPSQQMTPRELLETARRHHSLGIAYTYSEPTVGFEFVLETAVLFKEAGLKTVMVSNGYVNPEPLEELIPYIDAWNIDIKSMSDEFYRKRTGGRLAPVLKTVKRLGQEAEVHVEATTLLIPGANDSEEEIHQLVDWIAGVDAAIPLHFSAYHPAYQSSDPRTPESVLERAYAIAAEKLPYVFVGNVDDPSRFVTRCPSCKRAVIERSYMGVRRMSLKEDGRCPHCGAGVDVVL